MSYNKQLLVIDDEPALRMMVRAVVEDAGWSVAEASSGEAGIDHLASHNVNVVLLDMRMTGIDGSETLAIIQEKYPNLPVIMLTAFGTVGSAVEAMKRGAFDYLSKPADNDELIAVLEKAYTHGRLLAENDNLRKKFIGNDPSEKIIGGCAAMQDMLELIRQVGPTEATVLVMGESGTGKELIAEALHERSNRAAFPMVKINCAALPGNLLESELFGYVRGAFTGAVKDKPGRFQLAKGGTIFLDEIGEMPIELQAKLLRALQERVVEPLGAVKPVEIDVRIIAATNRNLREAVAKGEFREDLYFRLNVLELISPPLRDRLDDLPLLVSRLLDKLGRKNRKSVRGVSPDFMQKLTTHAWPGNVRELENVLERALILSRSELLNVESLPPVFIDPPKVAPTMQTQFVQQDGMASGQQNYGQPNLNAPSGAEFSGQGAAQNGFGQPEFTPTDFHRTDFSSQGGYNNQAAYNGQQGYNGQAEQMPPQNGNGSRTISRPKTLDDAERQALIEALNANGGHRERTADALGISRRTLQYKLRKYGLTKRS
ncbi:sigma-54 dependent transcriptional regulator [Halodesulfovibrio sp. MK-HDV]|jgi:two-component system, NtrC family, response regulator|uniref:sigma-54-dependent transcriptional regulator n=1 Tax=Halodesulfovibrio sp. MK-HDV TaxID=2599925 RepID=UPI00136A4761|nr:sigma-54 dependent transcriptional regulator [Halodesulfovibrio sp. MK-HDV]KAF1076199.1 Transcriptional regulatory protein ZraR [Halodesulfovibrio sp. MK-HDV]